jgi:hypothetical protein
MALVGACAVKFRLIDNTATLFPNSRSPLAPLLELVGGEQNPPTVSIALLFWSFLSDSLAFFLCQHDEWLCRQLVEATRSLYELPHDVTVSVTYEVLSGDHHLGGVATTVPQGRTEYRDNFSKGRASAFDRVWSQGPSHFKITWLAEVHRSLTAISEARAAGAEQREELHQPNQDYAALRKAAEIGGKLVLRTPMFCNCDQLYIGDLKLCPPVMHNIAFYNRSALEFILNWLVQESPSKGKFLAHLGAMARASADGKLPVSASSYRTLIAK